MYLSAGKGLQISKTLLKPAANVLDARGEHIAIYPIDEQTRRTTVRPQIQPKTHTSTPRPCSIQ
jgi:hypothetical protein